MTTTINWIPRRDNIDSDSFSDITTSVVTSLNWETDGSATIVFADDLTDSEVINVKFRMGSKDDAEGTLFGLGLYAIIANLEYTGTGYTDAVNTIPQVMALSDQLNNLWRLVMGPLADLTPP